MSKPGAFDSSEHPRSGTTGEFVAKQHDEPSTMPDRSVTATRPEPEDLPGMWEEADLLGGWSETQAGTPITVNAYATNRRAALDAAAVFEQSTSGWDGPAGAQLLTTAVCLESSLRTIQAGTKDRNLGAAIDRLAWNRDRFAVAPSKVGVEWLRTDVQEAIHIADGISPTPDESVTAARTVLDAVRGQMAGHIASLTVRGRKPNRANECVCLGCKALRSAETAVENLERPRAGGSPHS